MVSVVRRSSEAGNPIVIKGGTSRIGRALAEAFHRRGNRVIVAGRRKHLLDEIIAALPGMRGMQLDGHNPDAVTTFAASVREDFPHLNVLINNAGISRPEDLTANVVDLSVLRSIIRTNVVSVIELTSALLPLLKQQTSSTIHHHLGVGLRTVRAFPDLQRQQGFPSLLAPVAAVPTPKYVCQRARTRAALCADGTGGAPSNNRSARHAFG
jgi:short-subunit dehydrogenase involved in D-alanine esterification of teichoic acids